VLRAIRRRATKLLVGRNGFEAPLEAGGRAFRLVTAPPGTLLSDDKGYAALFCITVYYGIRSVGNAEALRAALRDAPWLDSLEASVLAALSTPLDAVAPPLEVSSVQGVTVALLDEKAPALAGAPATAADGRLETIASLSMPQPGERHISRRASIRAFLSRNHIVHSQRMPSHASEPGVLMQPRSSTTRRIQWVGEPVSAVPHESDEVAEPTPPQEPPAPGEAPAQAPEPLTWQVGSPPRGPPPGPHDEEAPATGTREEELLQLVGGGEEELLGLVGAEDEHAS